MAQNVFNFSGPVTIHVSAQPGGMVAPAREPAAVAAIPGASPEPEFREKTLKFEENYATRTERG